MRTVAIAGAGIIGLSSAWRLARSGWQVTVFDSRKAASEASWAAAGMLAPGGEIDSDASLAAMALRSLAMYPEFVRDLEEDSGCAIEFTQCGAIEVAEVPDDPASVEALNQKAARQAAIGIASEPCQYAGRPARRYPSDAMTDPLSINEALIAACRARGVTIRQHEPVTQVFADGSGIKTNQAEYPSDRVIIAAGAWSSALLPDLPRAYPIRGHLISYEMPPGLLTTILRTGDTYLIQRASGTIVAGSSMEYAGFNRSIDTAIVADLHRRAAALLPALANTKPSNSWNGLRPATGIGPVIGQVGDTNVWTAYGHLRNGILLAPDTAQTIAAGFGPA